MQFALHNVPDAGSFVGTVRYVSFVICFSCF